MSTSPAVTSREEAIEYLQDIAADPEYSDNVTTLRMRSGDAREVARRLRPGQRGHVGFDDGVPNGRLEEPALSRPDGWLFLAFSHAGNSISLRGCTMLFQILSDRGQGVSSFQKGDGANRNFLQSLLIGSRREAAMACRQSDQGEGLQLPR